MEPTELRRRIAGNVRRLADARGLSLNLLAELAGISRTSMYKMLSCQGAATTDRLAKLATALDVPVCVFFVGSTAELRAAEALVRYRANPPKRGRRRRRG